VRSSARVRAGTSFSVHRPFPGRETRSMKGNRPRNGNRNSGPPKLDDTDIPRRTGSCLPRLSRANPAVPMTTARISLSRNYARPLDRSHRHRATRSRQSSYEHGSYHEGPDPASAKMAGAPPEAAPARTSSRRRIGVATARAQRRAEAALTGVLPDGRCRVQSTSSVTSTASPSGDTYRIHSGRG
jgi:hypothetical protein